MVGKNYLKLKVDFGKTRSTGLFSKERYVTLEDGIRFTDEFMDWLESKYGLTNVEAQTDHQRGFSDIIITVDKPQCAYYTITSKFPKLNITAVNVQYNEIVQDPACFLDFRSDLHLFISICDATERGKLQWVTDNFNTCESSIGDITITKKCFSYEGDIELIDKETNTKHTLTIKSYYDDCGLNNYYILGHPKKSIGKKLSKFNKNVEKMFCANYQRNYRENQQQSLKCLVGKMAKV